jgi:hypothetical protein
MTAGALAYRLMKTIGIGLVILVAAIGGLVAWNKHKQRQDHDAYQALLQQQYEARKAVADKHRPAATAKLAAIEATIADARKAAPVTARTKQPLPSPPRVANAKLNAPGNTLLVGIGQPAELKVTLLPALNVEAARYLDGGSHNTDGNTAAGVELAFAALETIEYVLLVRVLEASPPTGASDHRFVAGRASGDGALYELATGKRVAAYPFSALQRDNANIDRHGGDVDKQLLESFTYDVWNAATKELGALVDEQPATTPDDAEASARQRFASKIELELGLGLKFVGASIQKVEVTRGPVVIFHAREPKVLMPGGKVAPDLETLVTKILGTKAEIRAVAAE